MDCVFLARSDRYASPIADEDLIEWNVHVKLLSSTSSVYSRASSSKNAWFCGDEDS